MPPFAGSGGDKLTQRPWVTTAEVAVFLPCHQTRLPQALHCCSYVRGMLHVRALQQANLNMMQFTFQHISHKKPS